MHAERGVVTAEAAEAINAARVAGGRVVAVGTTSLRVLESAADANGTVSAFQGDTIVALCEMRAGRLNPTRVFHLT